MLRCCIGAGKVRVVIFQHLILIPVSELADKVAMFATTFLSVAWSIIFDCTFTQAFIRASRSSIRHWRPRMLHVMRCES